jgi:hypothetical protein
VNDKITAQGKVNGNALLKQSLGECLNFLFCTGKVSTCGLLSVSLLEVCAGMF